MKKWFCLLAAAAASVSCVVETYDKPLATDPGWLAAGYVVQDMVRVVSAADLVRILEEWDGTASQEEKDTFGSRYFQEMPIGKVESTIEVAGLCRVETNGGPPGYDSPWTLVFEPNSAFGTMPYKVYKEYGGRYRVGNNAFWWKGLYVDRLSPDRYVFLGKNTRCLIGSRMYAYEAMDVVFESPSELYAHGWPLPLEPVGGYLVVFRSTSADKMEPETIDTEFNYVECAFLPEGGVDIWWRGFEHRYGYLPRYLP